MKRVLIPFLLLLASIAEPQTFDSASSVASRSSPLTLSHTTGTGTRRKMIACVVMRRTLGSNPAPSVTAANYNGVALTCPVGNSANSGVTFGQFCYQDDPASGAHTLSVSVANIDGPVHVHAVTLSNAEPGEPQSANTFADIGGARSVVLGPSSVETTWSDSMVLDCAAVASFATDLTPTSGQTVGTDLNSGILRSRLARKTVALGQHAHQWSVSPHATGRLFLQLSFARRDEVVGQIANSEWVSIPDSAMSKLYVDAIDDQWNNRGLGHSNAFAAIQGAWSGATCVGDELFIFGGGHNDSPHNGIFAVNVLNGQWRRVRNPSGEVWLETGCIDGICETPYGPCETIRCNPQPIDSAPASRHTYWLLTNDGENIYTVGGAIYKTGNLGDPPTGWKYNIASDTWTPLPESPNANAHGAMAYVDGKIYMVTPDAPFRSTFDVASETWQGGIPNQSPPAPGHVTFTYASASDRFFHIGGLVDPLATPNPINRFQARYTDRSTWGTAGSVSIPNPPSSLQVDYLGATYYPPEDLILIWDGGQALTTLNSTTLEWGSITPGGENPGSDLPNGTFGRLSYCGGKVALVNGVNANLFQLDIPEAGPICGDELLEDPEECDDGDAESGDGCSSTCTIEAAVCGNNIVETVPPWSGINEQCDDPFPAEDGDGCSSTCQIETPPGACVGGLPNGVVNEPEECDDGPNGTQRCSTNCEIIFPPSGTSTQPLMPYTDADPDTVLPALINQHCGDESTWAVLDATTDAGVNQETRTGKYILRVHWKETPYPPVRVRNGSCVKVIGIDGPEGQRAHVAAVNKTRDNKPTVFHGGLIIENLLVNAGLAFALTDGAIGGTVQDCVGVPNDQDFLVIRDSEVASCGHHGFLTGHVHQLHVELDNVHMHEASTHMVYIDHVAFAYIHDSLIESPGNSHALRSVAGNTIIKNTQISNIQFDGTILPVGGNNPLFPTQNRTYIGMHPLDIYVCGFNLLENVDITFHSAPGINGQFAANLRGREAFQTCDLGAIDGDHWESLSYLRDNAKFQNPATWANLPQLTTVVTDMTVRCTNPGVVCNGWDVDGLWPTMNDPEKTQLQRWLRSRTFANWSELEAEIAFNPEWAWIASRTLSQHRTSFMNGTNPNKIPVPAPIPGWTQRHTITLNNFQFTEGGTQVIRPVPPPDTFCYGTPAVGNACTEQFDGARYRQAHIVINP